MWLAQKRRIRDRQFFSFNREHYLVRAFAVAASHSTTWDLFPPLRGYRPYNSKAKSSYLVSQQRQHADWARLVVERDGYVCKQCGAAEHLAAHHMWPQSWYPNLRYVLKNGVSLCRQCHDEAKPIPEITPNQFLALTSDVTEINVNITSDKFWSYYVAGIEKGRVLAYGLQEQGCDFAEGEQSWFLTWAKLNGLFQSARTASRTGPFFDNDLRLNSFWEEAVRQHVHG